MIQSRAEEVYNLVGNGVVWRRRFVAGERRPRTQLELLVSAIEPVPTRESELQKQQATLGVFVGLTVVIGPRSIGIVHSLIIA